MEETVTMNIEMLVLSLVLLLVLQLVQATHTTMIAGMPYAFSPRDKTVDVGILGGRIQRTKVNLIENLMLFAPLSVLAEATHAGPALVGWGAVVFFVARIVHTLCYLAGIPVLRTLAWLAGVIGCIMIACAILGWA